jgi:WD40 repeat protein
MGDARRDGSIRIDAATGPLTLAAVGGGDTLAVLARSGGSACVVDLRSGATMADLLTDERELGPASSVAVDDRGAHALVGHRGTVGREGRDSGRKVGKHGHVAVWNLERRALIASFRTRGENLCRADFSTDAGRVVCVGTTDSTPYHVDHWPALRGFQVVVEEWDWVRGEQVSCRSSPIVDGRDAGIEIRVLHGARVIVASRSDVLSVGLWATAQHQFRWLEPGLGRIRCLASAPDRGVLLTAGDRGARIWSVSPPAARPDPSARRGLPAGLGCELAAGSGTMTSAAFSERGHQVVTGDVDGSVRVWDVSCGAEIDRVEVGDELVAVGLGARARDDLVWAATRRGAMHVWIGVLQTP